MNLKSGTPNTVGKFDSAGICSIIESCAKNRVTKITFGDVEVFFDGHPLPAPGLGNQTTLIAEKDRRVSEENAILQDELKTRDDQLEMMLIENPLEAERMIEQGLVGPKEVEDGDEGT